MNCVAYTTFDCNSLKPTFSVLVQLGITSIQEATNTRLYFSKLFKNGLYLDFFKKEGMWQQAKQIQKPYYKRAMNPVIANLIKQNILHFSDVNLLSAAAFCCVEAHPEFETALLSKQFNLLILTENNIHEAYCFILAERLVNIILAHPYIFRKKEMIDNKQLNQMARNSLQAKSIDFYKKNQAYRMVALSDTIDSVREATAAAVKNCKIELTQLQSMIMHQFTMLFKEKINKNPNASSYELQSLNLIKEVKTSLASEEAFSALSISAENMLTNIKNYEPIPPTTINADCTFYSTKRRRLNNNYSKEFLFYERLASLKDFIKQPSNAIELKKQ